MKSATLRLVRGTAPVVLVLGALAWMTSDSVAAGAPASTGPVRQTGGETKSLDALIAEHRAIRAQLDKAVKATLDRLTAQVRSVLGGFRLQAGLWGSTLAALKASGMQLDERERSVLATYVLDGIAAMDDRPVGKRVSQISRQEQDAQRSFNLQYLQLQSQLQQENRSYEMVHNIMQAKHDTVKNSISNIR